MMKKEKNYPFFGWSGVGAADGVRATLYREIVYTLYILSSEVSSCLSQKEDEYFCLGFSFQKFNNLPRFLLRQLYWDIVEPFHVQKVRFLLK
jgi:hypothetical protein